MKGGDAMTAPVMVPAKVVYPESDGEPMGEGDWHRIWMNCVIERLQRHFVGQRAYVAGNMMIYYEEGNPECCVCPDTFVVRDCDPRPRIVYKTWEDGPMPDYALEISSESTRREDRRSKLQLYARLGIKEYVMYDWSGRWLKPALQAFVLSGPSYRPVPGDVKKGFALPHLGVTFSLEDGGLSMLETASGKRLLSNDEVLAETEARLAEAQAQADRAKELLARQKTAQKALEDKLARLRRKPRRGSK
jgi:Uma2 family endonuclease